MKPRATPEAVERKAMLEWLRAFSAKAKRDPASLTMAELDELVRVVATLMPPLDDSKPLAGVVVAP